MLKQFKETEPRLRLEIPCTLNFSREEHPAKIVNISYSGLGIELLVEGPVLDSRDVQSVTVEGIGTLHARVLWKRGAKLGLKFASKRNARPALDAFFKKIGDYPF
ncbi:PilZ domain protein (plasmid) [Phaeobacter piscinae]|uniref:PilZ domain protein n=1 Tax=Phaeobacter piscinae TaxID=1580596 RepID=A0ABM6PJC4_9RHOB|nr:MULTISPECIES: PilZ domain-containing protein [Phaeobacter]ATG38129.1 PilZ domain protein [Phaeobacter piscinae]AUQ88650.1 PilZ domain protein [Phaeobacter piscinae]AUQ92649.1 PilZ domain protein [Phaeobacter inhibens]AUR26455.1 PilZ domain protein [Phaeobacter piscinae]